MIKQVLYIYADNVVPKAGLEPARPLRRGILNPLRLPFRHLGTVDGFNAAFARRPEAKHA